MPKLVTRVFDSLIPSGNGYKVHLLLSQLKAPSYETVELDILRSPSETRSPEFLVKNPNGRIPVVEFADGTHLWESNAILHYLSVGSPLLPTDEYLRAQVLQWMFFEQYSHEPYVAVLRFWKFWGGLENYPGDPQLIQQRGQAALKTLETQLTGSDYLVGNRYSVADISLYAYTQTAEATGFEVGAATCRWLNRISGQPRYIPMKADPLGKAPGGAMGGRRRHSLRNG